MPARLRYILSLLLLTGLMTWVLYPMLSFVVKDNVLLLCYVKGIKNTDLQLYYYDENGHDFSIDNSQKYKIIASQFYKGIITTPPTTKHLRLDIEESKEPFLFNRIELIINGINKKDTLKIWKGNEIEQLIQSKHDLTIDASTYSYLQLHPSGEDPYFVFNNQIDQLTQQHELNNKNSTEKLLLIAIIISSFFSVTLLYFTPSFNTNSLKRWIVNGKVLVAGIVLIFFMVLFKEQLFFIHETAVQEGRMLTLKPEWNATTFFEYPDAFSDYAKDNFSFRYSLFRLHSYLKTKMFQVSPHPKEVLMGKDYWFFENDKTSIDDYKEIGQVIPQELLIIQANLLSRKRWLTQKNIRFYIFVPPNKQRVYPEQMPTGYFVSKGLGVNRLDYYKEHLAPFYLHIIDPTDSLIAAKKRRATYYTSDTHWNLFGGFLGYQVLMQEIEKDIPEMKPLQEKDFKFTEFYTAEGDLARMIGLENIFLRKEVKMEFKNNADAFKMPHTSDIIIRYKNNKTINGSKLKVLMFRDSYANYLIPFINLHFKDATYVWSYEFMDKLIEEEKPDVIILESLQRFMVGAFMNPNPKEVDEAIHK